MISNQQVSSLESLPCQPAISIKYGQPGLGAIPGEQAVLATLRKSPEGSKIRGRQHYDVAVRGPGPGRSACRSTGGGVKRPPRKSFRIHDPSQSHSTDDHRSVIPLYRAEGIAVRDGQGSEPAG